MWMESKVRIVDIAAETGRSTAAALLTRNDLRITAWLSRIARNMKG